MIFNRSELRIHEQFSIKLNDEVLTKLEDAARDKKELLLTIDASHYGMLNGNGVIYRHDTVRNNIDSFIYPNPKPMIERHRPETSDKFGHIVAADYKTTKFYDELNRVWQIEGLSTSQYMSLCKNTLIPTQRREKDYNGLAYVQLMGKLKHQDAIQKVLKKEFLNVSIGADPKRLICSECGQDQVQHICDHYADKGNGIFMLAEELEYEELSFVPKGADPYGRVSKIHDGIRLRDSHVDVILLDDFYKKAENKTIVCVNNICTICDQEEEMAKRKEEQKVVSVAYTEEFTAEKVEALKIADMEMPKEKEDVKLADLADDQFAIVQKTDDGLKRRFPLHDEENVKAAINLIGKAEDLTEAEIAKAKKSIVKAAKKVGIECNCLQDEKPEETNEEKTEEVVEPVAETKTIESITDELVAMLKEEVQAGREGKLEDGAPNSLNTVLEKLAEVDSVDSFINARIKAQGKELVEAGSVQALNDELTETKEELALLDEQNRELNYQIRVSLVDEIMSHKDLGEDEVEAERKRLTKFSYDSLKEIASEFRKNSPKSKDAVINNKEKKVDTIKDPTLADELDVEQEVESKEEEKPLTEAQLKQALSAYFIRTRR